MPILETPAQTFTVTTTVGLDIPGAPAGLGLIAYVITSGISGTWTFQLNHVTPDGTVIPTHAVTLGITTNTATSIALAAPFAVGTATPIPNQVVATESVAGTVTARFFFAWSS